MSTGITVVGLGSGDEEQLSLGIWRKLQTAQRIYLRTEDHPVVRLLQRSGIGYTTFDSVYRDKPTFGEVYEAIADELLRLAETLREEIVYAVPGHPMVAEATVQILKRKCPERDIPLAIAGGESFLDQAFVRLGFDPLEGFQLLDGTQLDRQSLNPRVHTVVAQVYDNYTASEVKLTLMETYPDDYPVVVAHALGVAGVERVERIPLYDLDRQERYGNLTMLWVPRSEDEKLQYRSFARLHDIVRVLRSPEGCPWDREQTHASIRKNLIEETYEVIETIDDDDPSAMCEELGDLLLQVMLHSQIEEEDGSFSVYDVIAGLNEKLIRRHPHVFGDSTAGNADEALQSWEKVKKEEKRNKGTNPDAVSVLSGIPPELPVLMKAEKLQKKAARVGFDWDRAEDVMAKIEEELAELKEVAFQSDEENRKSELGDLLFAVVNLARFLKIDPDEALSLTNRKFIQRFSYIEEQLRLKNKTFDHTDLQEMEMWWQEAKRK
jgi:tetrapyrrole methylase family protein/MazG family protein